MGSGALGFGSSWLENSGCRVKPEASRLQARKARWRTLVGRLVPFALSGAPTCQPRRTHHRHDRIPQTRGEVYATVIDTPSFVR